VKIIYIIPIDDGLVWFRLSCYAGWHPEIFNRLEYRNGKDLRGLYITIGNKIFGT